MSISGGQEKIGLMATQSKTEKWDITSEFRTSNNYSIRCISERLGSLLPGPEDWSRPEAMVKAENKGIYKHTGAKSSKVCHINLYKNLTTSQNNSLANGHVSHFFTLPKWGASTTTFCQN